MMHPPHSDKLPLDAYLAAVAARHPTPGGGAVAAVTGASAAAIGRMVIAYSVGRKDAEASKEADLHAAASTLDNARAALLRLAEEDVIAYAAYAEARKHRETDPAGFQVAVAAGVGVPLSVVGASEAILALAARLAPDVSVHLLSDLRVCAELSLAAVRSGMHMVRTNLGDVADPATRHRHAEHADRAVAHAEAAYRAVHEIAERRQS